MAPFSAIEGLDTPPFDVVGVGAVCLDTVCQVPFAPSVDGPLSKVRVGARQTRVGGQTATALCACARFGLRAAFVGAVGEDGGEALVRRTFDAHGVDAAHLMVRPAETATALIVVPDGSGERMVLWHRDPALALDPSALPARTLERAAVVHVDDVDVGAAVVAARLARAAGAIVTTDIDQTGADVLELVALADYAIYAEHVPAALTGVVAPEAALAALAARVPHAVHCVTLGASGAAWWQDGALRLVAGHDVDVVDTTGAGDTFRAGFIYGVRHRWTMDRAVALANAAAALSCTKPGGIGAAPSLDEAIALAGLEGA